MPLYTCVAFLRLLQLHMECNIIAIYMQCGTHSVKLHYGGEAGVKCVYVMPAIWLYPDTIQHAECYKRDL